MPRKKSETLFMSCHRSAALHGIVQQTLGLKNNCRGVVPLDSHRVELLADRLQRRDGVVRRGTALLEGAIGGMVRIEASGGEEGCPSRVGVVHRTNGASNRRVERLGVGGLGDARVVRIDVPLAAPRAETWVAGPTVREYDEIRVPDLFLERGGEKM